MVNSATELRDDEINWSQQGDPDPWVIDQDCGAIAIAWRHRHDRPSGHALSQIGGNAVATQELIHSPNTVAEFTIDVNGGAGGMPVGQHG